MNFFDVIYIVITFCLVLAWFRIRTRRALDDPQNFVIYSPSTESVRDYEQDNRNKKRLEGYRVRRFWGLGRYE